MDFSGVDLTRYRTLLRAALPDLALNRIELHKAPVELGEAVARAVDSAQPMIDERQHELTIDADPEPILMMADPVRLEQTIAERRTDPARM